MTPTDCARLRRALGVTRVGLARVLKLDVSTIARAERGEGRLAVIYRALLAALETLEPGRPGEMLLAWLALARDGRERPSRKS